MKKYVALLRGVNVGGKNKISMPELKACFSEAGFQDVQTYINSGNIIFSYEGELDLDGIATKGREIIADKFNLDIPMAVLSAQELSDAVRNAPKWWDVDPDAKHNAIFVISPLTAEQVISQVGEHKPDFEQVGFYKKTIFWSASIKTFSRTTWSKITSKSIYNFTTIRNANTTKKLAQIIEN